jgi:membrane protease YdiL (CAAX protease family)
MTRFGTRSRRHGGARPYRNGLDVGAAVLTLGFGAVSYRLLPERLRAAGGAAAALGLAALAHGLGADARDLGVDRRDLASGLRVGGVAAAAIVAATGTARALDRTGTAFRDARITDASRADAAIQLLVRIPFATALVEELVFRGIILGFGLREGDRRRALAVSSIAFGLWHVGSALHPARRAATSDALGSQRGAAPAAVLGDVVATAVGGVGFGWLRIRSGSIAAPTIAHATLNASAYLATRLRRERVRTGAAR